MSISEKRPTISLTRTRTQTHKQTIQYISLYCCRIPYISVFTGISFAHCFRYSHFLALSKMTTFLKWIHIVAHLRARTHDCRQCHSPTTHPIHPINRKRERVRRKKRKKNANKIWQSVTENHINEISFPYLRMLSWNHTLEKLRAYFRLFPLSAYLMFAIDMCLLSLPRSFRARAFHGWPGNPYPCQLENWPCRPLCAKFDADLVHRDQRCEPSFSRVELVPNA